MRRLLALTLMGIGCAVAIPAPIDPGGLPPCAAGSYGPLSRVRCEVDTDCVACDLGAGCLVSDARCGGDVTRCSARCCAGRCVVPTESVLLE